MIAVILNSGIGSRMGELTANRPKCMVELQPGTTILSRQIDTLLANGIEKFVITTGHMADALQGYLTAQYSSVDIDYVHNPDYRQTNYIVSLFNSIGVTRDDVLLLHGDLVFSDAAAKAVIQSESSSVAVDTTLPLPEKDFKARLSPGGKVREIGVNIFGEDCMACQPFYRLFKKDWLLWQRSIEDFCSRGIANVYAENALNAIAGSLDLFGLDLKGKLCMEVDNTDDLNYIRTKLG